MAKIGNALPSPESGWSRCDDTHSDIVYTGTWNTETGSWTYGGTSRFSESAGAKVSFSFYGTKVRIIGGMYPNRTTDTKVFIDGVLSGVINEHSATPTAKALVFEADGLPMGRHTVEIIKGTGLFLFDAVDIDNTGFIYTSMLGKQITTPENGWKRYDAGWAVYPNGMSLHTSGISGMYGGIARKLTRSATILEGTQDVIQFSFYGSKLRLYACTYNDRQERMRLYVDGVDYGLFTSRYPTNNIGQVLVFEVPKLAKDIHQVKIVIDPQAPNGQFFFDAFDIDSDGYVLSEEGADVPEADTGWKRYEDDHPAITFSPSNGWNVSANAGHTGGKATGSYTNQKNNTLSFEFIGTKFRIIISKSNTYSDNIKVMIDGTDAGSFSARDTFYHHRVLGFQRSNLPYGRHKVELLVINKPSNSDGYDFRFDAIDIDDDGRLLHSDEVFALADVTVGKRIRAHYSSEAGKIGYFSGIGSETSDFLPAAPTSKPDGDFYLIAVDKDHLGRLKLLADRNIQSGLSWMTMNDFGFMNGVRIDKQRVPTVPVLNGLVSDDGTVTVEASSSLNGYPAWKAFDGLSGSDKLRWIAPTPGPAHITINFRSPKMIKHYSLLSNTYPSAAPIKWQLLGSDNGIDWVLLDERDNQRELKTEKFYSISNNQLYHNYRLVILTNNGYTGYFCSIDKFQLYEEDNSFPDALIRLPTGGSAATRDNEWDAYVTRSTLDGRISAGDNRVWNWKNVWSMTPNAYRNYSDYRTVRGANSAGGISYISTTDTSLVNTGFRPMFVMHVSDHGGNGLHSEIQVSHRNELLSCMDVYRNSIAFPESALLDVTVPVTKTDWKGYNFESSGIYNAAHAEWNAFDNSMTSTYPWAAPTGQSSAWLILDYGELLHVAGYGIGARPSYPDQAPRNWLFLGSNDKQNWEILDGRRFQPDWEGGELRKFVLTNNRKSYRYFKWEISNALRPDQLGVQQFELYAYDYMAGIEQRKSYINIPYRSDLVSSIGVYNDQGRVTAWEDLTLPMTSNTSHGYSLRASGNYVDADYDMFLAFNNVIGKGKWSTGPSGNGGRGWIAIDIVNPESVTGYLLEAPDVNVDDMAKTWTFEGSLDGNKWDVLDARSNEPAWVLNERRQYTLKSPTGKYRWFRINVTANIGGGWLTIGEIEIYGEIGGFFNQRKSYITIPHNDNIVSEITVKPHAVMRVRADVTPVYFNHMTSIVDVKKTENIVSYITVRPYGKMRVTASVSPPPLIEAGLSPVKDAFVRSSVPRLNYGSEQEMLVGRMVDDEEFKSLIQFDMSSLPIGMKLKEAYLKLYVDQNNLGDLPVSVYETQEDWTEEGVTWASQPYPGKKLAEIDVGVEKDYVEVNLLSAVKGWYDGSLVNKGILLKLDHPQSNQYVRIGTKERGRVYVPKLVIVYYDPVVMSAEKIEISSSITVQQKKDKDITGRITIKSYLDKLEIMGTMKVYNPNMLESYLQVSRGDMLSSIIIKRLEYSDLKSEIIIRNKKDFVMDSLISVSRKYIDGTLTIRKSDHENLETNIIVRRDDWSPPLTGMIGVSRDSMTGTIEVTASTALPAVITINKLDESLLTSTITSRRKDITDLNTNIDVWVNTAIEGSIIVKSGYLSSSIIVPYEANKDLNTKIRVTEKFASDLTTYIYVRHDSSIFCTILVDDDDGGYIFIL